VSVVSRAGWADSLHSEHTVATLDNASPMHADRPAVVVVGAGAAALDPSPGAIEAAGMPPTR